MRCSDYQLLIPYRRTGELLQDDLDLLNQHIASCPTCATLTTPDSHDSAIQNIFNKLEVPADLKSKVTKTVAKEQAWQTFQWFSKAALLLSIVSLTGFLALNLYGTLTKPKLDTEGLAIRNQREVEQNTIPDLIYHWLKDEELWTDFPFQINYQYYAAHGYEKIGKSYVPFIKFQKNNNQNSPSVAKLYFLRTSDVDTRNAIDGVPSSDCVVRVIPGDKKVNYVIVHTGTDTMPFINFQKPAL